MRVQQRRRAAMTGFGRLSRRQDAGGVFEAGGNGERAVDRRR